MNIKQLIKFNKILHPAVGQPFTIPGEPLIYSIKYPVGKRRHHVQHFKNKQFAGLMKCFFDAYLRSDIPVVIIVRFYVSPKEDITKEDLRIESTPARYSFEMCDYLLCFLEMLHHVLINSYCQIVKLDADKYYSNNPRTVFKFLKWEHYVMLQDQDQNDTETESLSKDGERKSLQSLGKRHEDVERMCVAELQRKAARRSATVDSSFKNAGALKSNVRKTQTAKLPTAQDTARRRQSRKVSE